MEGANTTTTIATATTGRVKAYAASLSGTALEWYDFGIYSAASALVFPTLFFAGDDPLTATLLAFSTYAVGYVSRPIGGFIFGRLGDIIGRKRILVVTLLVIGISTFAIGLLPGYATMGVAAPALLVTLRFAQGIAVGGEWGGAVLLSSEYADPRKRGFWASAVQVAVPIGNLLANGVLALLTLVLPTEAFQAWGWRVAFLASAVLIAFGLWIRLKLEETPVFKALQEQGEAPAAPIREVFRTQARSLVSGILTRLCNDITYALYTVFSIVYGIQHLGLERGEVLVAVMVGSAAQIALMPFGGWLSDRINRRLLYGLGTVAGLAWSIIFFLIVQPGSLAMMIFGVTVGLGFHAIVHGPQAAFVIEQFNPRVRSTGSSIVYSCSGILGGAFAPLIFTALFGATGSWYLIPLYIGVATVLTIVGLLLGRDPDRSEVELLKSRAAHAAV